MKIFVTGGRGFLGSWVVRALRAAGHELKLLLRKPAGSRDDPGLHVVEGDLLDRALLERALRDVDAVVHIAGLVSLRKHDSRELERVNVLGTKQLLDVAQQRGIRVLHTSSIGTLGYDRTPLARDERSIMPEQQAREFVYLGSKLRAEQLAQQNVERGGDVVILSPGVLLGPLDPTFSSTRPVLYHLRGMQRFCLMGGISYADVRDVAASFVVALEHGRRGQRYLLAGENLTYTQFFRQLSEITGLLRASPISPQVAQLWALWSEWASAWASHPFEELNLSSVKYGSLFNYCDCTKAKNELGYRQRNFRTTLEETISDHLQRGAARASTDALRRLAESPETHASPW